MIEIEINDENLSKFFSNIRQTDKEELEFFHKNSKADFINVCKSCKNIYFLGYDRHTPCAIGGVETVYLNNKKSGQVWLLCCKKYDRKFLLKYIKEKIDIFKKQYDILFNCIYKSNFSALIWLKKFGFSFVDLNDKNIKLFYLFN